ncbi:acyltransferase [Planococcus sp. N028]|uniref:Acyltransferase n=1 Tax=Planococcus shixiaomingii TaxID=3058393 RepID=A0ABT8N1A9_9BACL|nr:acyltransferase [Planococcus sp. N028]MDN7241682.1 acyltransferase [Planococcus sp. N028]
MKKIYFEEIPFVRAIACLMVVFVHITSSSFTDKAGSTNLLNVFLSQYSMLGAPIFAVISAFLLFGSVKQRKFSLQRFAISRTTKIIIPFILWTFFYLWAKTLLGYKMLVDFDSISKYLMFGTAHYHLYFMVTVIQFYLVFPLVQFIHNRKIILALFFLSLPINFLWFTSEGFITQIELLDSIINHRSFILNWVSFFLFGAVLAYYYQEIVTFVKAKRPYFIGLLGVLFTALYLEVNPEELFISSRPVNLIYVPIFVLGLMSIYGVIAKNNGVKTIFEVIGTYSMGIYLIHPLIKLILIRNLPSIYFDTYLIIFTAFLTVIISMIIVRVILFLPISPYIIPVGKVKKNVIHINRRRENESQVLQ